MEIQIINAFNEVEKKVLEVFGNRDYDDLRLMPEDQFQREIQAGLTEIQELFAQFAVLQYLYFEEHKQFYKLPEQYRIWYTTLSDISKFRFFHVTNIGTHRNNWWLVKPDAFWIYEYISGYNKEFDKWQNKPPMLKIN